MSLRCPATLSCCRGGLSLLQGISEWESKQAQKWQTGRRSGSSSWRRDLITPPSDFLPQATCCRAPRRRGGAVTRRQPFRSWECGSGWQPAEKGNEVSGWCSIASTLGKWLGDPAPSREEAQRNQTPSSRAGGVISQLLSQDSRVVTVYSVHCVQCVLSTSATASSPSALATIPTPSATFRPVRSVQDGCTVSQSS
jgi:hypothetical protein